VGKRVDAQVKKLTDLTDEVSRHCATVKKCCVQIEQLIGIVHANNESMNDICKKAEKDSKGRPVLTGDEDLVGRLKARQNWIAKIHGFKDDLVAAFDALTKDNAKDVAELIKGLESLLVEKKGLNKKTVPVLEDALAKAESLKKKIEAMKAGDMDPEKLPKLPT
jgi:hypothetical protein